MFAIAEQFTLEDHPRHLFACELDEPRHVVAFTSHGATVEVLNKVFDIEPESVERVAAAIFRARPEIRRIRIEVKFPPAHLRLPSRELVHAAEYVVSLPDCREAYQAALGKSTRKHLKEYENRLHRLHPGFELRCLAPDAISDELIARAYALNRVRIEAKGDRWAVDDQPQRVYRVSRLTQTYGGAVCGFDGGECVAAWLLLFVGPDCWWHTGGFDRTYEDCHLGMLMTSFTIAEAIRHRCRRIHMTWGTGTYKERLGAEPVTAWRVSLFRSRLGRALYAKERWGVLVRHRSDIYWRVRTRLAVKRRLRTATGWARRDGAD